MPSTNPAPAVPRPMPPWLASARKDLGVKEIPGKVAHEKIVKYFEATGSPIRSDEISWCSAFINYHLLKVGHKGTMSLAARSFMTYGKVTEPMRGAIAVFPRGGIRSWQGHVTFVDEVVGNDVWCVGGNQRNMVKRTKYRIKDAIAFRWPPTMGGSRTVKAMAVGSASTLGSFALEQAQEAQVVAYSLQDYVSWAGYAILALTITCFGLGIWFRWQDMKDKGR